MISPERLYEQIVKCGFTHVIWVPDSATGLLEPIFRENPEPQLIRVCREGESFAIAAGLMIGGKKPLVIIQCTGFFEAGDAMRNVIHDLRMPLFFMVGYRSYEAWKENPKNSDTARSFTEPILDAWNVRYEMVKSDDDAELIWKTCIESRVQNQPAAIVLGEP